MLPTGPAEALIRQEISRQGEITFARFMELALYDPTHGYYSRPDAGPGPSADYITSSEIHSGFGSLFCFQFEEMWRLLGTPSEFWLVEAGPGSGIFAANVLACAEEQYAPFYAALRVALIEPSASLLRRQQHRLGPWKTKVTWLDPGHLPSSLGVGCIYANEVLDAFPSHRVVMGVDGLRELRVGIDEGNHLAEIEGSVTTPMLEAQISQGGGCLRPGEQGEVCLGAGEWLRGLGAMLDQGYLLLTDYGAPAPQLYGAGNPIGTVRCYFRHTVNSRPLVRVGAQDITTHVDFSAVTRRATEVGLGLIGAARQDALLGRLGLPFLMEQAPNRPHRRALGWLSDPSGLGAVYCLLFSKGSCSSDLSGFVRTSSRRPTMGSSTWSHCLSSEAASRR